MQALVRFAGVAREPYAYSSLLYLLSRLPVAMVYVVVLVLGMAIAAALALVGIGLVIFALTLGAAWAFAAFERELVRWWLGQRLGPRHLGHRPGTVWGRVQWRVTSSVTWKTVAFLVLQLSAGLVLSLLFCALLSLVVAGLGSPVVYVVDQVSTGGAPSEVVWAQLLRWLGLDWATSGPLAALPLLGLVILGCGIGLATLHLSRWLGGRYGNLAARMLAVSEADLRLVAARAEADAQRTRAEELEQSRQELVMNVSHDLRTPIASIQGHVAALLDEPERAPEARRRYLSVVARETERLGALVDDLLLLARSDVDELHLELRPVDLAALIGDVAAALTPIARRDRKIALTCSLAESLPAARADGTRLSQVVMNLVRNAITYTPDGGIVSIEAAAHGTTQVAIVVADTGIGIPPEDRERIFERFVRGDASRSSSTGGFGLGLAIARDLVEAMGGTVDVESKPRRGSRFTILLEAAGGS